MRSVKGGGCYLAAKLRKAKGKSLLFSGVHRVTRTYVQSRERGKAWDEKNPDLYYLLVIAGDHLRINLF